MLAENDWIKDNRKEIEDSFGTLVSLFPIVGTRNCKYHEPEPQHRAFLGLCLALHNLVRFPTLLSVSSNNPKYQSYFNITEVDYNPRESFPMEEYVRENSQSIFLVLDNLRREIDEENSQMEEGVANTSVSSSPQTSININSSSNNNNVQVSSIPNQIHHVIIHDDEFEAEEEEEEQELHRRSNV